jgi:hypothetical protein
MRSSTSPASVVVIFRGSINNPDQEQYFCSDELSPAPSRKKFWYVLSRSLRSSELLIKKHILIYMWIVRQGVVKKKEIEPNRIYDLQILGAEGCV